MGKLRGFMEYDRINEEAIDPKKRIENYKEFTVAPKLRNCKSKVDVVWTVVYHFVTAAVH